eukprot:998243-Pyramimonas_sp.AAC.1
MQINAMQYDINAVRLQRNASNAKGCETMQGNAGPDGERRRGGDEAATVTTEPPDRQTGPDDEAATRRRRGGYGAAMRRPRSHRTARQAQLLMTNK